ncbi:MAG: hypothetical protein ACOX0A_01435 [Thermoguttaceae bacterium]|jgi:hypothetical protein
MGINKTGNQAKATTKLSASTALAAFLVAFLFFSFAILTQCEHAPGDLGDHVVVGEREKFDPETTLTPERLLREATKAYANAKYYSDEGYVDLIYERTDSEGGAPIRTALQIPCSLSFAKPNFVRMELGKALLRSDGKTMRAEIFDDAFSGQIIERPAPLMLTSVREFYPDSEFAAAANLGVSPDAFWTSPQLILLFSRDPFKTLAPVDAELRLLEPAYLSFENESDSEPILCDRLEIAANSGVRVYWFNHATHALVRCELPSERVMAPEPDARVLASRVEFPRQKILQTSISDLDEFAFDATSDAPVRRVERFIAPEIAALNQIFPLDAVEFDDQDAERDPQQHSGDRVLCFYQREDPGSAATLERLSELAREFDDVLFYAVDLESDELNQQKTARSLDPVLLDARLDSATLMRLAPEFPSLVSPSVALLDSSGAVLRLVFASPNLEGIRTALVERRLGRDPRVAVRNAAAENARRFERFMEIAINAEFFRTTFRAPESVDYPPRQMTKTLRLLEVWRYDGLFAPANPLAVAAPLNDSDDGESWETPTSEARTSVLDDLLVVPCDGNALALFSPRGKLLRKTTPIAAADEPIEFVRCAEFGPDRRFFVASAAGTARKLHRFDEDFNDLGSLNVEFISGLRVGDAQLADATNNGVPELFLSVIAAPDAAPGTVNSIYAIDMESRRVLWQNDEIVAPTRVAVDSGFADDGRAPACWTLDFSQAKQGGVSAFDAATGERRAFSGVKEGETLRELVAARSADGATQLAALGFDDAQDVAYLSGYDGEGNELWRNVVPTVPEDGALERLKPGDVDGDGVDEWILASRDGVVRFYNSIGVEYDVFQYGSEITGVCLARWNKRSYLIVTEPSRVSAWRVDRIRR